jgi:outer membrane murein-binding lipoprotein Lpp
MSKVAGEWTDARLNDLAAAVEPVPAHLAALDASAEHLHELAAQLTPVPAQVAVLTAAVDRLAEENHALRRELAATERQLAQIAWGLVAALLAAAVALLAALM